MGIKKILKKVKKGLKKAAPVIIAGLGAAALAKRKGINQGVSGSDKAKFTSNAAYSDDTMPSNISKSAGPYKKKKSGWDNWYDDSAGQGLKSGGRTGYSAGGAAKRGVSPILLKGKK